MVIESTTVDSSDNFYLRELLLTTYSVGVGVGVGVGVAPPKTKLE